MSHEKMIKEFESTIYTQMETLGVVLYDDAGNKLKPSGVSRAISVIARNIAQLAVMKLECQTTVETSGMSESQIRSEERNKAAELFDAAAGDAKEQTNPHIIKNLKSLARLLRGVVVDS